MKGKMCGEVYGLCISFTTLAISQSHCVVLWLKQMGRIKAHYKRGEYHSK